MLYTSIKDGLLYVRTWSDFHDKFTLYEMTPLLDIPISNSPTKVFDESNKEYIIIDTNSKMKIDDMWNNIVIYYDENNKRLYGLNTKEFEKSFHY